MFGAPFTIPAANRGSLGAESEEDETKSKIRELDNDFNDSQFEAIMETVHTESGVVLVHGPPGTGKTTTMATAARLHAESLNHKVLYTCHSNTAVDTALATYLKNSGSGDGVIRFTSGYKTQATKVETSQEISEQHTYSKDDESFIPIIDANRMVHPDYAYHLKKDNAIKA